MADVTKSVLTIYRAETAQYQHAVKTMRGVERDEAKKVLDSMNAHNAKMQDQIAMIGKVGAAVGLAAAAFMGARAAANAYLEDVRLQSAAAGANIDKLKAATSGLVEQDRLLDFAGKAMHGTWKLNNDEMERVLHGAMALRAQFGVELEPTIEKLSEAIAKGSTKSLREFGIEAKDKVGVLQQLDQAWASMGGNAALAGDEFKRSEVALADALDDLKGSLGELVIALAPVIEGLAGAVGLINDAITGWKMLFGGESPWETELQRKKAAMVDDALADVASKRGALLAQEIGANATVWARFNPEQAQFVQQLLMAAGKQPAAKKGLAKGGTAAKGPGLSLEALSAFGGLGALESLPGVASQFGQTAFSNWQAGTTANALDARGAKAMAESRAESDAILETWNRLAAKRQEQGNLLATIFGTSAEMNESISNIKLAAAAFETLTGAATAAFDAWITGSESIGMAFKKAVAEGLKANATQMLAESIKHAAFALGSLAFYNFDAAAKHGAAAAKFAVGAAAMGVMAKALGGHTGQWSQGGGGGAAAAGGGAARVGGGGGSRDQDQRPIIVNVGAEWAGMSSIEQGAAINRAIQIGKRGSAHIRRS